MNTFIDYAKRTVIWIFAPLAILIAVIAKFLADRQALQEEVAQLQTQTKTAEDTAKLKETSDEVNRKLNEYNALRDKYKSS